MICRFLFASAILLSAVPARADSDVQFWLTLYGEAKIDDNDSLTANAILRSRPDQLEAGQRLLRVGLSHKMNGGVALSFAYTHVETFNSNGPDAIQHRLTQGVALPLSDTFDARLQAEEIFANGGDIGLRARGRLRWIRPLDHDRKIDLQISDELIWAVNDTGWGQNAGWTANRAGAAVKFKLDDHVAIAPGYTWQLVNRRLAENRNDHVLGLTLEGRF